MKGILHQLFRMAALVLAAGLASALLVRYSPGALVDQRELNQRLSDESVAAMRAEKAKAGNAAANFLLYLRNLSRGELGFSESNNAPIAKLIADRAPATLWELVYGLSGGWLIGMGLAIPAARFRRAWLYDASCSVLVGLLLSLPAALIAYLSMMSGVMGGAGSMAGPSAIVLILVLAPRIFRFVRNLLVQAYGAQHVEMARARGVPERRILLAHILPDAAPSLLALFASSASMAIGAAIPVEAICDAPGLGRLAWQAATARDLPLLVNLTMLVTMATIGAVMLAEIATSCSEIATAGEGGARA